MVQGLRLMIGGRLIRIRADHARRHDPSSEHPIQPAAFLHASCWCEAMSEKKPEKVKVTRIHKYVQSLCGMYSRVARKLGVDRSYVSRVARGERHSEEIELALNREFEQVEGGREA
jgi:transcriptional regulator with XRE-family HTH domain